MKMASMITMDATSYHWMAVIMEYDRTESGRSHRQEEQGTHNQERRTRHTAPSQNKGFQTTNKPPGETFVAYSKTGGGETWSGKERRHLFLRKLIHSSSEEIPCQSRNCKATYCVAKKPVNEIHKRVQQSEQKKQWVPSFIWLHKI
jgi:hypothetical protein